MCPLFTSEVPFFKSVAQYSPALYAQELSGGSAHVSQSCSNNMGSVPLLCGPFFGLKGKELLTHDKKWTILYKEI